MEWKNSDTLHISNFAESFGFQVQKENTDLCMNVSKPLIGMTKVGVVLAIDLYGLREDAEWC